MKNIKKGEVGNKIFYHILVKFKLYEQKAKVIKEKKMSMPTLVE